MNGFISQPLKIGGFLVIAAIRLFGSIVNTFFAMEYVWRTSRYAENALITGILIAAGLIYGIIVLFFFFKRYKHIRSAYIGLEIYFALFNFYALPVMGIPSAVWAALWILYMLVSKRVKQTFVYDWDGIPDRVLMEKAGLIPQVYADVTENAAPQKDVQYPESREARYEPYEPKKRPAAKRTASWAVITGVIVLIAAVILYISYGSRPKPAADVEPGQNVFESDEPAEITEFEEDAVSEEPSEEEDVVIAAPEEVKETSPGESLVVTEDSGAMDFQKLQERFNNMPYMKQKDIKLEYSEFTDDEAYVNAMQGLGLEGGGACFFGGITGAPNAFILGNANSDMTINSMAFICYEKPEGTDIDGRILSISFIMATNPRITAADLNDWEEGTVLRLYGAQYQMLLTTPEDGAPYYNTIVEFGY